MPTQWEFGQPSDFFPENPARIKIPLGLLQRGVFITPFKHFLGQYQHYVGEIKNADLFLPLGLPS